MPLSSARAVTGAVPEPDAAPLAVPSEPQPRARAKAAPNLLSDYIELFKARVTALVVITALVLGLLRYRRRRISFSTRPEPGAIDRSGGYTASSGITSLSRANT